MKSQDYLRPQAVQAVALDGNPGRVETMTDWSTDLTTHTGFKFHMRPVQPEDEAVFGQFTLVPEPSIPSHQGPYAQSVDPDLDVVTMEVKVPETLGHRHYWKVRMTKIAGKDEVLNAFRASFAHCPSSVGNRFQSQPANT